MISKLSEYCCHSPFLNALYAPNWTGLINNIYIIRKLEVNIIKLRKDECPTCRQVLSGTLPIEFKRIMTIYKPEIDKQNLNINNYEDFPTL